MTEQSQRLVLNAWRGLDDEFRDAIERDVLFFVYRKCARSRRADDRI